MNAKIFISHASKNKAVAEAITEAIMGAFMLAQDDIICTSVDGFGLPGDASDFYRNIRDNIKNAKVVIYLISDEFCKSEDCLYEMAWGVNCGTRFFFHLDSPSTGVKPNLAKYVNMSCINDDGMERLRHVLGNKLQKQFNVYLWKKGKKEAIEAAEKYRLKKEEHKKIIQLALETKEQIFSIQEKINNLL